MMNIGNSTLPYSLEKFNLIIQINFQFENSYLNHSSIPFKCPPVRSSPSSCPRIQS